MRTLIAANWKMNGNSNWVSKPADFDSILSPCQRTNVEILICPPALYINAMAVATDTIAIGAQDCHHADRGAYTGEISAEMIKETGASYVIVGHSERRAEGETGIQVKAKAEAAIRHGLTPIICVGESKQQRHAGTAEARITKMLESSLPDTDAEVVVAYEPIWAIGTGKVQTHEEIATMHKHIREIVGAHVRILYGGSVKPQNAESILAVKNVNGALIGGASLEMESLAEITRIAVRK